MATKSKKPSQAALIRKLLNEKLPIAEIVAKVRKACGGKPDAGYVGDIARREGLIAAKPAKSKSKKLKAKPVVKTPTTEVPS